jgi:hypothetical protein
VKVMKVPREGHDGQAYLSHPIAQIGQGLRLLERLPAQKVTPSMFDASRMRASNSSTVTSYPPLLDHVLGLKQPGHRIGHPWTHRQARLPGPSALVKGRNL